MELDKDGNFEMTLTFSLKSSPFRGRTYKLQGIVNKIEFSPQPSSSDEPISDSEKGAQKCAVCHLDSEQTRALPRQHAAQYGLREEDVLPGARVCNTCRCKSLRSRYTPCPLPTCPNAKAHRFKRLRPLPLKLAELPRQNKDAIIAEFQIPADATKCCSACYSRIMRKLSPPEEGGTGSGEGAGGGGSQLLRWTEQEMDALKRGLRAHGNRWSEVAVVVGPTKTQHQCKNFYFNYKRKYGLDLIVQEYNNANLKPGEERKPSLTDEEESGSSTSSCDEVTPAPLADSDTASAGSPPLDIGKIPKKEPEEVEVKEEPLSERDSLGPPILTAHREDYDSSATETADEGQGPGDAAPPSAPSPLTVKDLMLGVIEMQLMKNQAGGGGPPPTISSILKTDHGFGKSSSLATLSMVGAPHPHPHPHPLPPDLTKENLVLVQVQQQPPINRDRETEGTLDLSIKKPRTDYRETSQSKHSPLAPPHSVTVYRTASTHTDSNYYHQVTSPQLSSKLSPKLSPGLLSAGGSIMHGTPVSSPSLYPGAQPPVSVPSGASVRYDGSPLLRQMTPPHAPKEPTAGSITQGTPVHQRSIYPGAGNSEYYSSGGPTAGSKRPAPTAQGFYPPRPPNYNLEQQRQIIMNDYITSQQMHGTATARRNDKTSALYYQRQGVIQRHNTKPPSPHHYPPGHEAFSSLVDVAVRQPSLPVPVPVAVPVAMPPDHKEGLGERFNRENAQDRFSNPRDQERFSRENHQIHHGRQDNHHPPPQLTGQPPMRDHQMHPHPHPPIHHHRELERERERERSLQQHTQQQQMREHQIREQLREQQLHHQQLREQQQARDMMHQKQHMQMHQNHQMEHHIRPGMHRVQNLSTGYSVHQPAPSSRPHFDTSGREANNPPLTGGAGRASRGGQGQGSDSSTVTAASLIDAIITHQINQPSNEGQTGQSGQPANSSAPQQQVTRPGDRLFQGFHREGSEANGKLSPLKSGGMVMAVSPDSKQGSITLGDHIESMINKDFPPTSRHASFQSYEPQAWKLRRALQQKELDQSQAHREKSDERNIVRMAGPPSPASRSRGYYEPPAVPLSPLDYVKNRIVEVMRTSEEEGGSKSGGADSPGGGDMVIDEELEQGSRTATPQAPAPFIPTSSAYTYPFSALNLNAGAPPPAPVATTAAKQPAASGDVAPEPAPLLSAQYEPLSDED